LGWVEGSVGVRSEHQESDLRTLGGFINSMSLVNP
jgi:hypothetical protein